MNAADFANFIQGGSVQFGVIGPAEVIKKLRELANRIEAAERPKIALVNAYSMEKALIEDFFVTTLVLEFAELSPQAKPGTKLYAGGGEGNFPLEVAGKPQL